MAEFNEEGYLSSRVEELSVECRRRYSEWFTLCEEFNRYCVQILNRISIHENNRQEYLSVALFLKLLGLFEGAVILARRCMANETKILLRTLMETLFKLGAISKNKEMTNRYYDDSFLEKQRVLKQMKKLTGSKFSHGLDIDKRIIELDNIAKEKGIKERLPIKSWAKEADLIDFYATAYPVLSWTTHSNVIDIAQYINAESDENIEDVSWQPQLEGIDKLLLTDMECTIIGLCSLDKLFNLGISAEIDKYYQKYKELAQKTASA